MTPRAAVYVLLRRGRALGKNGSNCGGGSDSVSANEILMMRRQGGWGAGQWSLPSGHVEELESPATAAAREVLEEVGVEVPRQALKIQHAMYRRSTTTDNIPLVYLDLFFEATEWFGDPMNLEPRKCDAIEFVNSDFELPERTLPHVREALRCCRLNIPFTIEDWSSE